MQVTRHGEGAALWSGEHGGRGVLLVGTSRRNVVEMWDWTLGPGDRHASEAHTAGTRELITVLNGSISVEVDGQVTELDTGDAIAFPGDVDHAYVNSGAAVARFWVSSVFEPGAGAEAHRG